MCFLRVKAIKCALEINPSQILIPNMLNSCKLELGGAEEPMLVAQAHLQYQVHLFVVVVGFKTACIYVRCLFYQKIFRSLELTVSVYLHIVFESQVKSCFMEVSEGKRRTNKSRSESKIFSILTIYVFLIPTGNEIIDALPLSEEKWPWCSLSCSFSQSMQIYRAVTKTAYYRVLLHSFAGKIHYYLDLFCSF